MSANDYPNLSAEQKRQKKGEAAGGGIGAIIGTALGAVGGPIGMAIGGFVGSWLGKNLGGMVAEPAAKAYDWLTTEVPKTFDAALKGISDKWDDGVKVVTDTFKSVKSTFDSVFTPISDGFSKLFAALREIPIIGAAIKAAEAGAAVVKEKALVAAAAVKETVAPMIDQTVAETKRLGGVAKEKSLAVGGAVVDTAGVAVDYGKERVGKAVNLFRRNPSALDLANEFTGTTNIKGMTEAQTRAYAGNVAKSESDGRVNAENKYGFIGQYQFGAEALAQTNMVDFEKLKEAKKTSKNWYGGGQTEFLNNPSNWKINGGKDAFLADKKLQDESFINYTNANISGGFRSGALNNNSLATCRIPDDCIDARRYPLFMGRAVMQELIKGLKTQAKAQIKRSQLKRKTTQGRAS